MNTYDARRRISIAYYTIVCVIMPFLFGDFFPKSDILNGNLNFVNIAWGCIFGVGWALSSASHLGSLVWFIGFVIWPCVVIILLVVLARKISHAKWWIQVTYAAFLIVSFCANVKPEAVNAYPWSDLPIFWKYFEAAW